MPENKPNSWELPAGNPSEYHAVEAARGREFILRLTTNADPNLAIARFAREKGIRYGKVHAAFMGAFKPCRYLMWVPDPSDPENWHREDTAVVDNLSMLCAVGGMIGIRKKKDGTEESFVAMHFVAGGGWNVPTFGGHLADGTIVCGVMQVFITELLGIEYLSPSLDPYGEADTFPENWYSETPEKVRKQNTL